MLLISPPVTFGFTTGTCFGLPVFGSTGPFFHLMRPVDGSCSNTAEAALRISEIFVLKNLSTGLPRATSATMTSFFGATTVESFMDSTFFVINLSGCPSVFAMS